MRWVGLFFALGVIAMMGVMLTTMSANASAQLALTNRALSHVRTSVLGPTMTSEMSTSFAQQATKFDLFALQSEPQRKSARKRSGARCARITTTCWKSA